SLVCWSVLNLDRKPRGERVRYAFRPSVPPFSLVCWYGRRVGFEPLTERPQRKERIRASRCATTLRHVAACSQDVRRLACLQDRTRQVVTTTSKGLAGSDNGCHAHHIVLLPGGMVRQHVAVRIDVEDR